MDKYSIPPDWAFPQRAAEAKRRRAYKPTGVKYPNTGVAIQAIGQPDVQWTYSVPWSQESVVVLRYDRPDRPSKYKVLTKYKGG